MAPGHGGGTGSFDVTEALAAGPLGNGSRPGAGGDTVALVDFSALRTTHGAEQR